MTQPTLGATASPPTPRSGGRWAAARRLLARQPVWQAGLSVLMTLGVIASMLAPAAISTALVPSFAAVGIGGDGQMITNTDTLPRGAVWLDDATAQGGHLWVSDAIQGICRVDPAPGLNPPWQRTNCNGTAKSGGQIVVGAAPSTAPAGTKYIYVADDGSKSTQVVRYTFNPNATITNPLSINAQNLTARGGGLAGGRPVGIALVPNAANTDDDLYVAYLKSGDVMKVSGVRTATATPAQTSVNKVGSTSDGRGVNALLYFNGTLYLAELGGNGISTIPDPSGFNRPACSNLVQCTATSVGSGTPSFFPGGLAADPTNTYIYVGDAPQTAGSTGKGILRWNPTTGVVDTYSLNVPQYSWTDSSGVLHPTTQYTGPVGLGVAANGDLYVGDDPTLGLATPVNNQGHVWKVAAATAAGTTPPPSLAPTVTGVACAPATAPATNSCNSTTTPVSGPAAGGSVVNITGTNFTAGSAVFFGSVQSTTVSCASATQCTATSPGGTGTVDITVQANGLSSATGTADKFTYTTTAPAAGSGFSIASLSPSSGFLGGGTSVTIGVNNMPLGATPSVNFGPNAATPVTCTPPPTGSTITNCLVTSPAGTGAVEVQVTATTGTTSVTTPLMTPQPAADTFTYIGSAPNAAANLYGWGITAPKGGAVFLPGALGGHWWSSDHAQGFCRQDPSPDGLHAINFSVCGDDAVGSAGQAVYDPRPNADGTHYVYVPDNAVKSTAVWRLTFDPKTETMVADPNNPGVTATGMASLDPTLRTLKPNGMALGPQQVDANGNVVTDPTTGIPQVVAGAQLYVTDLTEANIRSISNPMGDPRAQAVTIVAQTGDLRGANGTAGFIGNNVYISENRGTSFFDVTKCTGASVCATVKIPLNANAAGVFVAGTAVDATHKYVYVSDSPGGANATVYRYDAHNDNWATGAVGAPAPIFATGGALKGIGNPIWCAVPQTTAPAYNGCQRPWDTANHPLTVTTGGFSFAFGLAVHPVDGSAESGALIITEDPTAGNRSGRGSMWEVPFVN